MDKSLSTPYSVRIAPENASISLNSDKNFPFVVCRSLILLLARKDRALTAHNSMISQKLLTSKISLRVNVEDIGVCLFEPRRQE